MGHFSCRRFDDLVADERVASNSKRQPSLYKGSRTHHDGSLQGRCQGGFVRGSFRCSGFIQRKIDGVASDPGKGSCSASVKEISSTMVVSHQRVGSLDGVDPMLQSCPHFLRGRLRFCFSAENDKNRRRRESRNSSVEIVRRVIPMMLLHTPQGSVCPANLEDLGPDVWNPRGIKILGTPIGSQEFIQEVCEERLQREGVVGGIPWVPQCAWQVLLRAGPRCYHLLRTLGQKVLQIMRSGTMTGCSRQWRPSCMASPHGSPHCGRAATRTAPGAFWAPGLMRFT